MKSVTKRVCCALTLALMLVVVFPATAKGAGDEPEAEDVQRTQEAPAEPGSNEAPMLRNLVAAGKLPPVEERLPDQPLVVEPYEEVGTYGGTIHVNTNSTINPGWSYMSMAGSDALLTFNRDLSWGHPNIVESYDLAEDGMSVTLHLRKGLKWSDGAPFTSEDFVYYYDHVLLDEELTPRIPPWPQIKGGLVKFVQVDDYTVRWDLPTSFPSIVGQLNGSVGQQPSIAWPWGSYQAAHYAKQLHPDFADKTEIEKKAKEAGFENWTQYYWDRTEALFGMSLKPNAEPVLSAYVCVEKTTDSWTVERNPYYFKVDTAGNQLPYIDRIVLHLVQSPDVTQGQAITGEIDFHPGAMGNMALYQENAESGGYRVLVWRSVQGSTANLQLNLTHEDPALREIFRDDRFRKALSLAINREEINKQLYFGMATPRAHTVPPYCEYFKPEFAAAYADYDPDRANRLLDETGLSKQDADGFRLGKDGKRLQWTLEYPPGVAPIQEMVQSYFKDVGLDMKIKEDAFNLFYERSVGNQLDMALGGIGQNVEPGFTALPQYFVPMNLGYVSPWCNLWAKWHVTNGAQGEEPPQEMKQLIAWWQEMRYGATSEEDRVALGQNILQSHADNVWIIGTIGMQPEPLLVNENLMNIPDEGAWGWDLALTLPYKPEQFFLKGAEALTEASPALLYEGR